MNIYSYTFKPLLHLLKKYYFPKERLDNGKVLKISIIYMIGIVGVLYLMIIGSILILQGSHLVGSIDLFAAFLLSILVIWPSKKDISLFVHSGIFISFFLFLFLFINGGPDGRCFVWSYTFPLLTFFLIGTRQGLIINSLFFLCCAAIILFDIVTSHLGLYDLAFAFRYTFSFLFILLLSFFSEYFRHKSETAHKSITDNLEFLVAQRTEDLEKVVVEKEIANEQITQAKKEWERTFDAVPAYISIIDPDFNIIRANKSIMYRLKLPFDKIIGQKCYNIVDGLDAPPSHCPHVRVLKDFQEYSTEIYNDKDKRHYFLTVSPLHDGRGTFIGSVHVAFDITEKKAAEAEKCNALEKLRKAEKIEAIGLMAGGVAHDLNNILCGVVGYPELLLHITQPDNPLYEPLKSIRDSGKRAAAVVSDLLTVTRGVATNKEIIPLNDILEQYFASVEFENLGKRYPSVAFDVQLSNHPLNVLCTPIHIQKIIMNLVTNSFEAVEKIGKVSVITENKIIDASEAFASPLAFGEYAVLTVKDSGSGISKHDLDNIFEPFYSKKIIGRSGTGLGLAIVKNIVDDHGATIGVSSDENGTIFTLYFPACKKDKTNLNPSIDVETLKGSGSVLIVDDEKEQRKISKEMLEYLGYSVKTLSSGEEAVDFCRTEKVDLILLDMLMDPGINGLETYQNILDFRPNQKTIFVSGFATNDDIERALKLGADSFMEKPYSILNLGQSLKEALRKQEQGEA